MQFCFWQGRWSDKWFARAERLARNGANRATIRALQGLRGARCLERGEWALAVASFSEAVRMARERGLLDPDSETGLALAKYNLGTLTDPVVEADRLAEFRSPAHRWLAQLYFTIGDSEKARKHVLAAYTHAWADGEPFVNRYELTKTTELLKKMKIPIPNLPPFDPAKYEKLPWEDDVAAAIEKLRAEKEAESKGRSPSS